MTGADDRPLIADLEDGYTKIPNLLLEALAISDLNRVQLGVCLFLLRRTHGWNREDDAVALSEFAAACGCSVSYVSRQVLALVRLRVMRRVACRSGRTPVYAINPVISDWHRDCVRLDLLEQNSGEGIYHRSCLEVQRLRPGSDQSLNLDGGGDPHLEANGELLRGVGVGPTSALEPPALETGLKKGSKKQKKSRIYRDDSIESELSQFLLSQILRRLPGFKRPDLQRWAGEIDLMLRLDQRPAEEIRAVIRFAQHDPFWQNNILSPAKLRKQYDMLNGKRLAARGIGSGTGFAGGNQKHGGGRGEWEEADEYKGFYR